MSLRIAMIGTRGAPARYGGFESAVEEIGARLADRGHDVVVYCRNEGQTLAEHRGMRLVNLPAVRERHVETLSHAAISTAHAIVRARPDVAFMFNAANAPYLRPLRLAGIPVAVNLDGFESLRAKWSGAGASYFRWAERVSVRQASAVIADSTVMRDHVLQAFGREAEYIAYGAEVIHPGVERLATLDLAPDAYHLVVARFEPENQVREIVAGFVRSAAVMPLAVVGSAPYAQEYSDSVRRAAEGDARVRLVGAVWDQLLLDELYGGARSYVHGHTVGGTNPSLLRAMGAGAPVVAHDNPFNREVAGPSATFFADSAALGDLLLADEADPAAARLRGEAGRRWVAEHYRWDDVAADYERLAIGLTARGA